MLLRVVDIETTGMTPPAEIIEFGRCDVTTEHGGWKIEKPMARLYRPTNGIPPETMAIHHITEQEIPEGSPVCSDELLQKAVWGGTKPEVLVAHNCEFERKFISEGVTQGLPWICTMKAAMRVWPDAPSHSNQVLRYWRGLRLDHALAMPPHRAAPDTWVTAHLLAEILKEVSVEELIDWTTQPKLYPRIPFGKHRGAAWSEVPLDYLQWVTGQKDMEYDVVWCARQEIARRKAQ